MPWVPYASISSPREGNVNRTGSASSQWPLALLKACSVWQWRWRVRVLGWARDLRLGCYHRWDRVVTSCARRDSNPRPSAPEAAPASDHQRWPLLFQALTRRDRQPAPASTARVGTTVGTAGRFSVAVLEQRPPVRASGGRQCWLPHRLWSVGSRCPAHGDSPRRRWPAQRWPNGASLRGTSRLQRDQHTPAMPYSSERPLSWRGPCALEFRSPDCCPLSPSGSFSVRAASPPRLPGQRSADRSSAWPREMDRTGPSRFTVTATAVVRSS